MFHCKKTNGRVGTVFKILHFAVKSEWPFGCTCKILYFPCKKNQWLFGCTHYYRYLMVQFVWKATDNRRIRVPKVLFHFLDKLKWEIKNKVLYIFSQEWTLKFKSEVRLWFLILIWKTKKHIYLNKHLMRLVTISPYATTTNNNNQISNFCKQKLTCSNSTKYTLAKMFKLFKLIEKDTTAKLLT